MLAVIWHYWIGIVLLLSVVGLLASLVVGYVNKVIRPKYPSRR